MPSRFKPRVLAKHMPRLLVQPQPYLVNNSLSQLFSLKQIITLSRLVYVLYTISKNHYNICRYTLRPRYPAGRIPKPNKRPDTEFGRIPRFAPVSGRQLGRIPSFIVLSPGIRPNSISGRFGIRPNFSAGYRGLSVVHYQILTPYIDSGNLTFIKR